MAQRTLPRLRLTTLPLAALWLAAALGGCDLGSVLGGLNDIDLASEAMRYAAHGEAQASLIGIKPLSKAFLDEDPTIDPSRPGAENLVSMCNQLKGSVRRCAATRIDCSPSSLTLTATFADCAVNDISVSGTLQAALTGGSGAPVTVRFLFMTDVSLDGHLLKAGSSFTESTADGTSYRTAAYLLHESGVRLTFDGTASLDAATRAVTLDGIGTTQKAGEKYDTTFTVAALHRVMRSCYPDGGTITASGKTEVALGKGQPVVVTVTKTGTFDGCTPQTGQFKLTLSTGERSFGTSVLTLPAYGGRCPPASTCAGPPR